MYEHVDTDMRRGLDLAPSHPILKEIGDALSVLISKEIEGYMQCDALIKVLYTHVYIYIYIYIHMNE